MLNGCADIRRFHSAMAMAFLLIIEKSSLKFVQMGSTTPRLLCGKSSE